MPLNFRKYAEDAEAFLHVLAERLGTPDDRDRAARILKNVLHLLRDQISAQESAQLVAQLPMFLKAIYVDGWRIGAKQQRIGNAEAFISEVRYPPAKKIYTDFTSDEQVAQAIRTVFAMLEEKVSQGEISDIVANLPADLRPLFQENYTTL